MDQGVPILEGINNCVPDKGEINNRDLAQGTAGNHPVSSFAHFCSNACLRVLLEFAHSWGGYAHFSDQKTLLVPCWHRRLKYLTFRALHPTQVTLHGSALCSTVPHLKTSCSGEFQSNFGAPARNLQGLCRASTNIRPQWLSNGH